MQDKIRTPSENGSDADRTVEIGQDEIEMSAAKVSGTLPDLDEARRICQSLAVLDAILCPEWEYRYFSFNDSWGPEEKLASMRNGEGDDWLILWNPRGAIVKGFQHSAPMAHGAPWPGVLDQVPAEFQVFLDDAGFSFGQTTFCLWRRPGDDGWCVGDIDYPDHPDPDGAHVLLRFLDGNPETYRSWGEEYYGAELDRRAIEHIYRQDPLSPFVIRALNPETTLEELGNELAQIGYPK